MPPKDKTPVCQSLENDESIEPRPSDVLLGRGRGVTWHPGNRRFHEILFARHTEYHSIRRRSEKTHIVHEIADTVAAEGNRFLKKRGQHGWTIVGDAEVRKKIGQALRHLYRTRESTAREGLLDLFFSTHRNGGGGGGAAVGGSSSCTNTTTTPTTTLPQQEALSPSAATTQLLPQQQTAAGEGGRKEEAQTTATKNEPTTTTTTTTRKIQQSSQQEEVDEEEEDYSTATEDEIDVDDESDHFLEQPAIDHNMRPQEVDKETTLLVPTRREPPASARPCKKRKLCNNSNTRVHDEAEDVNHQGDMAGSAAAAGLKRPRVGAGGRETSSLPTNNNDQQQEPTSSVERLPMTIGAKDTSTTSDGKRQQIIHISGQEDGKEDDHRCAESSIPPLAEEQTRGHHYAQQEVTVFPPPENQHAAPIVHERAADQQREGSGELHSVAAAAPSLQSIPQPPNRSPPTANNNDHVVKVGAAITGSPRSIACVDKAGFYHSWNGPPPVPYSLYPQTSAVYDAPVPGLPVYDSAATPPHLLGHAAPTITTPTQQQSAARIAPPNQTHPNPIVPRGGPPVLFDRRSEGCTDNNVLATSPTIMNTNPSSSQAIRPVYEAPPGGTHGVGGGIAAYNKSYPYVHAGPQQVLQPSAVSNRSPLSPMNGSAPPPPPLPPVVTQHQSATPLPGTSPPYYSAASSGFPAGDGAVNGAVATTEWYRYPAIAGKGHGLEPAGNPVLSDGIRFNRIGTPGGVVEHGQPELYPAIMNHHLGAGRLLPGTQYGRIGTDHVVVQTLAMPTSSKSSVVVQDGIGSRGSQGFTSSPHHYGRIAPGRDAIVVQTLGMPSSVGCRPGENPHEGIAYDIYRTVPISKDFIRGPGNPPKDSVTQLGMSSTRSSMVLGAHHHISAFRGETPDQQQHAVPTTTISPLHRTPMIQQPNVVPPQLMYLPPGGQPVGTLTPTIHHPAEAPNSFRKPYIYQPAHVWHSSQP